MRSLAGPGVNNFSGQFWVRHTTLYSYVKAVCIFLSNENDPYIYIYLVYEQSGMYPYIALLKRETPEKRRHTPAPACLSPVVLPRGNRGFACMSARLADGERAQCLNGTNMRNRHCCNDHRD